MTSESKQAADSNSPAAKAPYVFISHHSEDADVAEEFAKVLKRVSAGMVGSFRSTDKVGVEGIPYGEPWFTNIMTKLEEATHCVALDGSRTE